MKFRHHPERGLRHLASGPFLYAMIFPLILLDLSMEVYHRICFPLYGIPYVKRSRYIVFDRHKLSYLTFLEKMSCEYCAYANGLLFYAATIAAETEKYWCSVKHAGKKDFVPPPHHSRFLGYNDKEEFQDFIHKH